MKVLVTGSSGQLGSSVCSELKKRNIEYLATTSSALDITNYDLVIDFLANYKPSVVIHCAAYTKVDDAEKEPQKAFLVNETGTKNIACACKKIQAKLLYISTDYIFSGIGTNFYKVDDVPSPINIYGKSKLKGEQAIKDIIDNYWIVRTSWVCGADGNNFVKTMLRLADTHSNVKVVSDQIGSPTFTYDLSRLLCDIIVSDKYGVYHATNEGVCSWAEFAENIFQLAGKKVNVERITSEQYNSIANRPKNSRLDKSKLIESGFSKLPNWKHSLKITLKHLGYMVED